MIPGPVAPAPVVEPGPDEATGLHRREAVAWLQWAMVRQHDPGARLARARGYAEHALRLSPGDPDGTALLAVILALEGGQRPPPVPDPALRARLRGIHPRLAALIEENP